MSAAVPFVGPAKHKSAAAAFFEGRSNLPVERVRLFLFAMAKTVEAEFPEQQRALAHYVVKVGDVVAQALLVFQINVEANQIDEIQLEIFRRWIIDVR